MKKINKEELNEILKNHKLWLEFWLKSGLYPKSGKQVDLSRTDLSEIDFLDGADLRGADLTGVNLSGANLYETKF